MEKTKAEEYEALQKIEEILKDFDPEDTYIGKAFEGCVEQADENLRSDFMMSYKDRYDNVSEQLHAANVRIVELTKELNQKDDAIGRLANAKNQLESQIVGEALIRRDYEARIGQMESDYKALQISYEGLKAAKKQEAAAEVHALRQTILELKAKLYDMMAGEEVEE